MKHLENISISDLKHILKYLKGYQDMTKKLGQRGKKLFQAHISGHKYLQIEHVSVMPKDLAYEQSLPVFQKSFGITPDISEIQFVVNDNLKGGMKIFVDDNMVDMSFAKVEKLLQR